MKILVVLEGQHKNAHSFLSYWQRFLRNFEQVRSYSTVIYLIHSKQKRSFLQKIHRLMEVL